ncbi:site-specific DNA-methyltransferase [Halomonas mongoliensis]|uniref:site-specific DNA-methyltransferase (adenine-specific) n=1 Tax=Halomonas mongoliensis TaxID=321265 RepID=A0ABU1GMB6_9GAMM|nr:site-specific DNA-methyltransferase [Halomonas mongoliensis]MDR5893138.1 site-specific DNA-methyltransferase [Halomonas mongoliensis]
MDKLKMHSPNLTEANIAKLAELFPSCVTEARDEQGRVRQAIDFDQLRQELSEHIVEGPQERYHLNWPGKREALLAANAPIAKTLRPCREESVEFDNTKNLFIEGDNLEALKLLQETYLGKVKMIYIDPPYNTGNDFVYKDDFSTSSEDYFLSSNQVDEVKGRLVANPESNGRRHSDWLSMMYGRIRLSRNLLRDDGLIFISIDDNELANLIKICDEIFGEENLVANFVWEKRTNRENRKVVSSRHDYLVCYCKNIHHGGRVLKQLPMSEKALANYKNPDNDPRGPWKSDPATAQAGHGTKSQFYTFVAPNGTKHDLESGRCWLYTEEVMKKAAEEGRLWFGKEGSGVPRIKTYLNEKERGLTPESIWFARDAATNEQAKNYLKKLFDGKSVFDTPKPIDLIEIALRVSTDEDDLVLDFFGGSATTAHAVMRLNKSDAGRRRFVVVQLDEPCLESSDAFKNGYETVSEIALDRIRRAAKDLSDDLVDNQGLDFGVRVLKIGPSNMKDVYYNPDILVQDSLKGVVDNVRDNSLPEDLLFQVLLDWGVDLSLSISRQEIDGKTIFFVDGAEKHMALAACFDLDIDETFVKQLAEYEPLRVVFRDAGFASDSVKINVEQIFAQKSPNTDVKVI